MFLLLIGTLANQEIKGGNFEAYIKEIKIASDAGALKQLRISHNLSRKDLASRLKVSVSAVEKIERGVDNLSEERVLKILQAIGSSVERFYKVKNGKSSKERSYPSKNVLTNCDRRSYQKIITAECKALKSLRRIKNISQDNASSLCGYSRSTIGHIENGRIELSESRIRFIVSCYGGTFDEFLKILNNDRPRDILEDECIEKFKSLSTEKLELINNLLKAY